MGRFHTQILICQVLLEKGKLWQCWSFFKIYLFIFGGIGSSLWRASFLSLQRAGATLRCGVQAFYCSGFSCCGAWALGTRASVVVAHRLRGCGLRALERRLSSCGARAQLLHSMWDLPGPGLEPVSAALAGRFLTTVPPGKPWSFFSFFFFKLKFSQFTMFQVYSKVFQVYSKVIQLYIYIHIHTHILFQILSHYKLL